MPALLASWYDSLGGFGEWVLGQLVKADLAPFFLGFCVSLVRPAVLVFLFLVLFRKFGLGLGALPLFFWRSKQANPDKLSPFTRASWWAQLMVGVGVGALVWQVMLSGYLFEEFASIYTIDRPPFCEARDGQPRLDEYPDFPGRFRYDPQDLGTLWRYAGLVLLGLAISAAGVLVVVFVAERILARWGRKKGWTPFVQKPRADTPATGVAVLRFIGLWTLAKLLIRTPAARKYLGRTGRIPWSPFLPIGVALGAFLLSAITTEVWVKKTRDAAVDHGRGLMRSGALGGTSYRQDKVQQAIVEPNLKRRGELIRAGSTPTPLDLEPDVDATETAEDWAASLGKVRVWLRPYVPLYGAFTFNFLLIAGASVLLMTAGKRLLFTPAVGILFLINLWVWASLVVRAFFPVPVEYFLLGLLLLMLVNGRAFKMKFPNLPEYYARPVDLEDFHENRAAVEANVVLAATGQPLMPVPAGPATPNDLPAWKANPAAPIPRLAVKRYALPGGPAKPPLVLVCVSGGGSRAAAWTMKTLLKLEQAFADPATFNAANPDTPTTLARKVAFPYHIRLVTGASGGMIAGAHYVASLQAPDAAGGVRRAGPIDVTYDSKTGAPVAVPRAGAALGDADLFEGMCADILTPNVHTLVTRDLPSWFSPMHLGRTDRGQAIEREWTKALHGQLDQTFGHLAQGEQDGWRPSLIFSPMMIEDGRQLFISNLDLGDVVRNRGPVLGDGGNLATTNPLGLDARRLLSREGVEFFKLFPHAHDFRLSTAVRMSASFPYVLPAVPLPTNPPRRVVDAGYYDNYGVGVAASWLFNNLDWVEANTSGVVVVQIRDGASGPDRRRERVADEFPSVPEAGLHGITAPPVGLWNFRQASHSFRNDNLLHLLDDHIRVQQKRDAAGKLVLDANGFAVPRFDDEFFTTVSFELQAGDDVALNLCLTEGERFTIEQDVKRPGFNGQVAAVLDWWQRRVSSAAAGGG